MPVSGLLAGLLLLLLLLGFRLEESERLVAVFLGCGVFALKLMADLSVERSVAREEIEMGKLDVIMLFDLGLSEIEVGDESG